MAARARGRRKSAAPCGDHRRPHRHRRSSACRCGTWSSRSRCWSRARPMPRASTSPRASTAGSAQRPVHRGDRTSPPARCWSRSTIPQLLTKLKEAEAAKRRRPGRSQADRGRHARRGDRRAQGRGGGGRGQLTLAAADLRPDQAAHRSATSPPCRSSTRRRHRWTWRSAAAEQAKLAYDEAVAGYTPEERGVAQAAVAKADAAIATLQAQVGEMTVKAPIGGAGLSDRRRARRICVARRAAAVAGRSRRRLAALRPARGPRQGPEGRRPLRRSGSRRSATSRSPSRSARSPRAANMPAGARRARPATSISGPSRSAPIRSSKMPELRPGMSAYADWTGQR